MANFCGNCGSPLKEGYKFCENCGASVEEDVIAAASAAGGAMSQRNAMERGLAGAAGQGSPWPGMPSRTQRSAAPGISDPIQKNTFTETAEKPVADLPVQQERPTYDFNRTGEPARGGLGAQYEPDEDFKSMFLRYDNRLNRKRYILRSLMLLGICILVAIVIGLLVVASGIKEIAYLGNLVSIATAIVSCMLTIRRLHDLNRPAWWCIGAFIPLVNFVMAVYLLFFKGTDGPNDYGPDPLTVKD